MVVKAFIFDLFETLISEFENGARKGNRNGDYGSRLGVPTELFRQEWRARQAKRMKGSFRDFPEVIREILHSTGRPVEEQTIEQLYLERIAEKRVSFQKVEDSILTMLDSLKSTGLKLAVLSNCTEEEVQGWHECSLAPYFDEVVFSYMAGSAKPDRRIYDYCCDRLGVRPSECVFVGDGGSNELDGASAAGLTALRAVWFLSQANREEKIDCVELNSPLDLVAHVLAQEREMT